MKSYILLCVLLFLFSLFFLQCTNDAKPYQSSPLDYKWSADTIDGHLYSIWGGSSNNVYSVGWGNMYRFDGHSWTRVTLSIGSFSLYKIHGFSNSDIWAVGSLSYLVNDKIQDSSIILHNNGGGWYIALQGKSRMLFSIGGQQNNAWVGGINKTFYSYDGKSFKRETLPNMYSGNDSIYSDIVSIAKGENDIVYALVYIHYLNSNAPDIREVYMKNGNSSWIKSDSNLTYFSSRLWVNHSNELIGLGNYPKIKRGSTWSNYLPFDTVSAIAIAGSSNNNLVVAGNTKSYPTYSAVYYYNGTNWTLIPALSFQEVRPLDIAYFDDQIFILCSVSNSGKTVIFKGHL